MPGREIGAPHFEMLSVPAGQALAVHSQFLPSKLVSISDFDHLISYEDKCSHLHVLKEPKRLA